MNFRKFDGPWRDLPTLGCRNLFCGDRLVLDLFEYRQSSPDEEVTVAGETFEGSHLIGLTAASRIWRITFDRPFALKLRDVNLRRKEPDRVDLPGPCSYTEDSDWIRAFDFEQTSFVPTHYVFATLDGVIEILGQDQPEVEERQDEEAAADDPLG
jgi:hypothetical protein